MAAEVQSASAGASVWKICPSALQSQSPFTADVHGSPSCQHAASVTALPAKHCATVTVLNELHPLSSTETGEVSVIQGYLDFKSLSKYTAGL